MKHKSLPGETPTIGVEIEANWPSFDELPEPVKEALRAAARATIVTSEGIYSRFQGVTGTSDSLTRNSDVDSLYRYLPEKYKFPAAWSKSIDSGVELKFTEPADTVKQAENWISEGTRWLRDFGHHKFSNAGTHIHLGHMAWLDKQFGPDPTLNRSPDQQTYYGVTTAGQMYNGSIRHRAEMLFWGYFATREAAIFAVTPKHRNAFGGWASPCFTGRTNPTDAVKGGFITALNAQTPLWAFHNHLISATHVRTCPGNFGGSTTVNLRKWYPTLEFRYFAGTNREVAVRGYVRLLSEMFRRATTLLTEDLCRARTNELDHPVLVNPFTYTIEDLKKEIQDPWVSKWIDATLKANGEPIETLDEAKQATVPQAVAVG